METFDPHSSETTGYHLFLMPTGSVAEELQQTITQLAEEYGGPIFPPHVTLLGRIPDDEKTVLEKAETLAKELAPIVLTLGPLQSRDVYYKALFATIAERDAMHTLHEKASKMFGMQSDPSYQAHLSLLYGNYPEERKAETRISLSLRSLSFTSDSIHLYRTAGGVESWQKVVEFSFT